MDKLKTTMRSISIGLVSMVTFLMLNVGSALPASKTAAEEPSLSLNDKCPPPYFVRGFDKETGSIVCGRVTGCPYGDSVPLGPECDRLAPVSESDPGVVIEPIDGGK